ncbi:MAG: glycosyltransferase family 2 protein [Pseudomonadales bacterium]|nr:glycosyltransferase family 2 protein [Pseudomonadales bacterium]
MTTSNAPALAVLLPTYNGEKYLPEQLESLLAQSYSNFQIVVRDDGSNDNSAELLKQYAAEYPNRIHLVQSPDNSTTNLGASGSFSFLMDYVLENKALLGLGKTYMMFCDQDDVWYPDKIERQMQLMQQTEQQIGESKPVLVHSDLRVVSEEQELIAESLALYQGLETERNRFCNIAISNLVTGCTALINEALARKALPVSSDAIMHDWWLAMVASAFGKLVFINEPLVHYRQHGQNTIGAKEHHRASPRRFDFLQRAFSLNSNVHLQEVARQATAFTERFEIELSAHDRAGLKQAAKMSNSIGFLQRIAYRRARRY